MGAGRQAGGASEVRSSSSSGGEAGGDVGGDLKGMSLATRPAFFWSFIASGREGPSFACSLWVHLMMMPDLYGKRECSNVTIRKKRRKSSMTRIIMSSVDTGRLYQRFV